MAKLNNAANAQQKTFFIEALHNQRLILAYPSRDVGASTGLAHDARRHSGHGREKNMAEVSAPSLIILSRVA
jgi:hypothetical protein